MPAPLAENPLLTAWKKTLGWRGATPAILDAKGSVMRTFSAIELEAMKITRLFDRLPAGSVVAVQLGNSERWPEVLLALWRRGLVPMPLADQLNETEMAVTLGTICAAALVSNTSGPMTVHQRPVPPDAHIWRGPTPDLLKLTSGTTAAARAIRFRAAHLLADCDAICQGMGITEHDLNYGVIPFAHSYGFSNLILPLIAHGVRLVAAPDRMPRAVLDGLATTGATVFPGTPVFYQKFAELDPLPELPALRLCISAGAPLPKGPAGLFTARTGRKIHSFYGSSECGGISYDGTTERRYEEGFVGTALPGVKIVHTGEDAAPIMVNSPAVGDGYFPTPDPVVLGNGTFTPGDLVRAGQRGLYVCGRTTDLINIAGRKLNPSEVEARIAEFPGVEQVIVFGIPSTLRGEEPIAAVTGPGLNPDALQRYCQENLPAWQVPRAIWRISELPASDRGKISRKSLANRYLAAHPRAGQG